MVKGKSKELTTASVAAPSDLPTGVVGEAASERTPVTGSPIGWIMRGIFGWGVILALGVLWYDYDAGQVNLWKPLLIIVIDSLFVAGWLLAIRSGELRRQRADTANSPTRSD